MLRVKVKHCQKYKSPETEHITENVNLSSVTSMFNNKHVFIDFFENKKCSEFFFKMKFAFRFVNANSCHINLQPNCIGVTTCISSY